jgi:hypothetical protein
MFTALNWKLWDIRLLIEKPVKVRKVLDKTKAPLLSYRELLQIIKAEWDGYKYLGECLG